MTKIDKIVKKLPSGWKEEADAMGADELRGVIVTATANIERIGQEAETDDKLNAAKSIVKDLGGSYSDARKAQHAKVVYAHHRLAELGAPINDGSADSA